MPVSLGTANSLLEKMTAFRQELAPSEQDALDDLLETFAVQAGSPLVREAILPSGTGLIAIPEGAAAIRELRERIRTATSGPPGSVDLGPTITLTTTTTTVASHPVITCGPSDSTYILATLTVKIGCAVIQ